jgi:hypothetical protein
MRNAESHSELIRNSGSCRQSVVLLERGISPVARPLPTQDNKNTKLTQIDIDGPSAIRTHALFEQCKRVRALDRPCDSNSFSFLQLLKCVTSARNETKAIITFRLHVMFCATLISSYLQCAHTGGGRRLQTVSGNGHYCTILITLNNSVIIYNNG